MLRYETLLLARTDITDNDLSMIEKQFDKHTSEAKGRLISFDKWGKLRLAYSIKKSTHGVYVLVRYELPPLAVSTVITELDSFFKIKCSDIVLRYVTAKVDPSAPAIYPRPDAIEGRTGSLDNFLKENKIDNLLSSVDANAGAADNNDSE
jgi:small subunit ribosomal protein S6